MILGILRLIVLVVDTVLWVPVVLLASLADRDALLAYRVAKGWAWFNARLSGARVHVCGLEHLDRRASYVFVSNHRSNLDVPALVEALWDFQLRWVAKRELLRVPFFGWGLALLRPIAIDRGQPGQALKTILREGQARLDEGISVVIYPEGTRQPPGQVGRFNAGGAMLACRAGRRVLPIAHNAGGCWPARSLWRVPGTIRLVVGDPIDCAGETPKTVNEKAEAWIRTTLAGLSRDPDD